MGLGQPLRCIVIGHRILISICVLAAVLATVLLRGGGTTGYAATARIQATTATIGSDTEADSVLNRVKGVATSTAVVARALRDARITDRNAGTVAGSEISVSRLGSSPIMDITITDKNAGIAERLASQLADDVVGFLNGDGGVPQSGLTRRLEKEQNALLRERQALVVEIGSAPTGQAASLSARLSTVEQEVADVASTLRQLQVGVVAANTAAVVSHASSASAASSSRVIGIILGALVGLVGGLLIAAVIEAARPRIAGARAVAAELDAPYLGELPPGRTGRAATAEPVSPEPELTLSLRGVVTRANVSEIVVVGNAQSERALTSLRLALSGLGASHINGHDPGAPASYARVGGSQRAQRGAAKRAGSARPATDVATAPPTLSARAETRVQVTTVDQLATAGAATSRGLLVLAGDYMPVGEVQRIRDLARSTDWPIVGVVQARPAASREGSNS